MTSPFETVFNALNEASCEFVVVGGVAVLLHGYQRFTADIDLAIALTEENTARTIKALTGLGLRPRAPVKAEDFTDACIRQQWIVEKNMMVFSMYHPGNALMVVDLFVQNVLPYESLISHSEQMLIGDAKIKVASIDDLICMKQKAGRIKDKDDIEKLQQIKQLKKSV